MNFKYDYMKILRDQDIPDKYMFFVNKEKRAVMGKLFRYSKGNAEVTTRVVKCASEDNWDPVIGIAVTKLKLDTSIRERYVDENGDFLHYGWKDVKIWTKKGVPRPSKHLRKLMNDEKKESKRKAKEKKENSSLAGLAALFEKSNENKEPKSMKTNEGLKYLKKNLDNNGKRSGRRARQA